MMPSELPPRSRTGEGHGMLLQVLQFETSTIFSQLQGGKGGFSPQGGFAGGEVAMTRYKEVSLLIAFFTLIRLLVAPSFGLGVDEAHYILYATHPALSYFDHPPLVGWLHAPFYYLLGTNELLARLPAIILFALTSFLAYRFTMAVSASKKISLLAVLALNSSFMFNALSLMLLPDSILLVLIFLFVFVVRKIEESPQLKYFIWLGLILGLAGLAKYTSILLVPPFLAYWLLRKRYDLIMSPKMIRLRSHCFSFDYSGPLLESAERLGELSLPGRPCLRLILGETPALLHFARCPGGHLQPIFIRDRPLRVYKKFSFPK